jgi:D-methionine transport system substrate-binding protein
MYKYLVALTLCLFGCSKSPTKGLKVMASPVPHAEMLEFIRPDLEEKGIPLQIIVSDDYNIPNRALANKEIDANFFQHLPFLEEQIKQFHYPIENYAKIEIEPMGIYSKKLSDLASLQDEATIAIPNDPTNEGRALLLFQKAGLITLSTNSLLATPNEISANPKKLKFLEVDAAMLPRSLDDVDAAAINTNYALEAGLSPEKNALLLEDKDSPYVNILVIRTVDAARPELEALRIAMTSDKMRQFILTRYKGAILPAFYTKHVSTIGFQLRRHP